MGYGSFVIRLTISAPTAAAASARGPGRPAGAARRCGGTGSGPVMSVGAALALRDSGSDRLPVAVLGDGDFLMGVTALWTAVRNSVPLLVVVANNRSFFNDELHQDRVARQRGRPVENRRIGQGIRGPPHHLAAMA